MQLKLKYFNFNFNFYQIFKNMIVKSIENDHIWGAHDILSTIPSYIILQKK